MAIDQTHEEATCEWCGEKFTDKSGRGQRYCNRSCAVSARFTQEGMRRGRRRISAEEPEEWKARPTEAARASGAGKRGKWVRLVCGTMLKYIEWDGMGFQQGKRRVQSGSYPCPKGQSGEMVEINEKEWTYLLSRSIVPFKGK